MLNKYQIPFLTEKKYQHLHGIVPPLKNVRRRRFRKTLRKKPIDLASIEKEVKRLLRMDIEAIEVKFEEVTDDTGAGKGALPPDNTFYSVCLVLVLSCSCSTVLLINRGCSDWHHVIKDCIMLAVLCS